LSLRGTCRRSYLYGNKGRWRSFTNLPPAGHGGESPLTCKSDASLLPHTPAGPSTILFGRIITKTITQQVIQMIRKPKSNRLLDELIANLSDDPKKIKIVKKPSVREAIIELRELLGNKVFTKRQLKSLIEAAFPELAPVAMSNLDASMSRASDCIECVLKGEHNVYRYKQAK
jgi:hypothetical protein